MLDEVSRDVLTMGIFSEAMSLSFAKWQHRDSYDDLTALVWSPYSGYCNLSFDYLEFLTSYVCSCSFHAGYDQRIPDGRYHHQSWAN